MNPEHTGMYNNEKDRIKIPVGSCCKLISHNRIMQTCSDKCPTTYACPDHCPPPRIKGDSADVWNDHWQRFTGVASVLVLPPKRNRYPILKGKFKNRDTNEEFSAATLCKECTEMGGRSLQTELVCNHPDELRAFHTCITFEEALYALDKEQGYELLKVYEVHYFTQTMTKCMDQFLGLFAKEKIVNSGWGDTNVDDPEERQKFVQKLRQETGFQDIQECEIQDNEPLKSSAKNLLNATIGKQGQDSNRSNQRIVRTTRELFNLANSRTTDITGYKALSENAVSVSLKPKLETLRPYKNGIYNNCGYEVMK